MLRTLLTLAAVTLAWGGGISVSEAQPGPGPMHPRPGMMMPHGGAMGQQAMRNDDRGPEMMGLRHAHSMMMRMMFIAMDTNGDGALSQEEFQAVHNRMFSYADANKDARLTLDEPQGFYHGSDFGPN